MMAAWLRRAAVCGVVILALAFAGRWWIGPAPHRPAETERLRAMLRMCMPGASMADLGNGEVLALYQRDFAAPVPPDSGPAVR